MHFLRYLNEMGNATWFNYNCTGSTESNKYNVQKPESALFYTDR